MVATAAAASATATVSVTRVALCLCAAAPAALVGPTAAALTRNSIMVYVVVISRHFSFKWQNDSSFNYGYVIG